ncbi:hypothetical protein [Clostridium botulinum]|uniref:hypothetical protein n=1 Tax=Clostridium botulinum TaxID=1491 RepID=UPI0013FEF8D2|nr:hypothetical protein [Clostridium botulinum]MBY6916026.1 hypothetical protein [Clostridium botulinum]NFQ40203.1 hypothetical protein [Clostridium botulinum]
MEESINFKNEMGVRELRQLHELSNLNKALNQEEYMQIVLIYKGVIERLAREAEKQGIEI